MDYYDFGEGYYCLTLLKMIEEVDCQTHLICLTNYFYDRLLYDCGYVMCDNFFIKSKKKIIIDDLIGVKLISKAEWRDKQINSILED